ncbi:hypothetical protein LTR84_000177 [Exophiala bonariae]|uniref:Amino acid permease/ SLC12A domain-containing protein n=1 Tax=Exophiala bonariae TaxID=1690606 RepID=A0AAV9NPV1_9EURO|nr:hypothetical protein LTR84_000177 [Exophiala bonariae]
MACAEVAQNTPSIPTAHDADADADALKLASMGYQQDLKRNFSLWSVLGVAFSLTNSWFGVSASMVTGINSGGPVLLIYGILLIALITSCAAISLSELVSMMPNAAGQSFWAAELAPSRYAKFAGYSTGCFAWVGSLFTTSSVALAMATAIVGLYQLTHAVFEVKAWHVIVVYQALNAVSFLFNIYDKVLPTIAKATLYISLLSFAILLITVPSFAPSHNSPKFVFATFINNTGWQNNGVAFIIGLMNPEWAFACLDCATHLAEEVHDQKRRFLLPSAAPIQDLESVTFTATGVPIIEIFRQATSNTGACLLESLIILTGIGCLIACHTWQSRLCWSFARDAGLPGHRWLRQVHPTLGVPLMAHLASCVLVALVGLLYSASTAAFSSTVTACIVLLYVSYSIPVIALLMRGRSRVQHGPFWLGNKPGFIANLVLLTWTGFIIVVYSFPTTMPATPGSMNYVSALYLALVLAMSLDWFVRARWEFRGHLKAEAKSGGDVAMIGMRAESSSGCVLTGEAAGHRSAGGNLAQTNDNEAP